jgi:hypothetical protein
MSDRVGRGHIVLQHKMTLARPTRFERVTFVFGGQNANQPCCPPPTEIEGLGQCLDEHDGFHEKIGGETPAFGVAQVVGFGLAKSKMLDLSMGID